MNIQFHNAQGELYLKEKLYIEAESSFEKALALARRHSNLYEEAKACANLGRLALAQVDNRDAMANLKLALATFSRIGAMFDVITVYHDLTGVFLGAGGLRASRGDGRPGATSGQTLGLSGFMHQSTDRSGRL